MDAYVHACMCAHKYSVCRAQSLEESIQSPGCSYRMLGMDYWGCWNLNLGPNFILLDRKKMYVQMMPNLHKVLDTVCLLN